MIAEAKLDVIKVPGLIEMLSTKAGSEKLHERFSFAMTAKSTINATLIDGDEEWERIALTFANMDQVMGMYLNIAAGAADIPATRLLGREPAGMNATGASDLTNYYDRLQSDQKVRVQPALARLDEVVIRHALGSRPEEIHYEWKPLWQMTEDQKSQIWLRKAQAHKIDVDTGLINPDVLREVRANQCIEDGFIRVWSRPWKSSTSSRTRTSTTCSIWRWRSRACSTCSSRRCHRENREHRSREQPSHQ